MKNKLLIIIGLNLLSCILMQAQTVYKNYRDGVIYFKVKESSSLVLPTYNQSSNAEVMNGHPELKAMIAKYGVTEIVCPFRSKSATIQHIYRAKFTDISKVDGLTKELLQLPYIAYAEKAQLYQLFFTPNDIAPEQWYFNLIDAHTAWDLSMGSNLIKVAIVDNAFHIGHADLAPSIYSNPNEIPNNGVDDDNNGYIDDVNGWDVADSDNDPEPPNNFWTQFGLFDHGTHCAGIVGAATNNGTGIASIGNGIKIIPVKGTSDNSLIPIAIEHGPEGIDYAIAAGANVISLSWGGGSQDSTVTNMVNAALASNIIVVAAAGNNGDSTLSYPAALPGVISVGAITKNDYMASFSQYGSTVDVVAPGDSIWSTIASAPYGYESGTSMACPMVAGLCGLMLSYDPAATPSQVESCLKAGCQNIDMKNPSYVNLIGSGRINAFRSLTCMNPSLGPIADYHTSIYTGTCNDSLMHFYSQSVNGDSLYWSFPGGTPSASTTTNPVVSYAAPGTYTVTLIAQNAFGADTTTGTINIYPSPAASFNMSNDTVFLAQGGQLGLTSTSTNATTYLWDFGDNGTASGPNATHTYTAAGTYTVTLTAGNPGCSDVVTAIVYVSSYGVGIHENLLDATVSLFPNPAKDQLTIDLGGNKADEVTIYSSVGTKVITLAAANRNKIQVDISSFAKGVYYTKVLSGKDVAIKKFTVIQ